MNRPSQTSKALREERKAKAISLISENPRVTQQEIADALGVSRITLWRYMRELTKAFADGNAQALPKLKEAQVRHLLKIAQEVHEGKLEPEAGNSVRGLLTEINRILGLHAPTKSLSVKVNADVDRAYLEFQKHTAGLDDAQLQDVLRYAASLPRKPVEMNPEWFHQPQKLLEGNVNVEATTDSGQEPEAGAGSDREGDRAAEL